MIHFTSQPYWIDLINLPSIITILLFSFGCLEIWIISFDKIKKNFLKYEYSVYLIIIIGILLMSLILQFTGPTSEDLRYPARISFMISQGLTPYLDFFEHHNPLYGYLTSFIFLLFDELAPIYILHILSFLMLIASCIFIYKIGFNIFENKRYSYLMVLFFLSFKNVIISYNIRQDVPAALFLIISVFYLTGSDAYRNYFYSGLVASISFLFVQKTILHIFAIFFILALFHNDIKTKIKKISTYSLGLFVPSALFYGIFFIKYGLRGLKIYYVVNFLYNSATGWGFDVFNRLFSYFITNGISLILIILGLFIFIKKYHNLKKSRLVSMLIFFNILILLLFVFKFNRISPQDFIYFIPFLSIPGMVCFVYLCNKVNKRFQRYFYILAIFLLLIWPLSLTALNLKIPRDNHEILFYLKSFYGQKTNCNFIYNPLTQYHWSTYFGNAESRKKIEALFKKYDLEYSKYNLEQMIEKDFKIICIETDLNSSEINNLIKTGYLPYTHRGKEYKNMFFKKE